ncbi:MAG: GNAT family N-acetyltransferase [Neomegalonema sp.]|nr:GNAT family N-acetyltransferase [Neomegalonema sp.]
MDSPQIRPLGSEAAAQMAGLHKRAFENIGQVWSCEDLEALLSRVFTRGWGVFAGARLRSFILFQILGDEAEILTLASDPEHRRSGHARSLLEKSEKEFLPLGVNSLFLEVSSDNHPAISLYSAMGFAQIGLRKNYYRMSNGESTDALVMQRKLMKF